jgi:small subunit ribosomal protein S21
MRNLKDEEVVIRPLEVVVINDNFEDAFRKFKALVQKEQVLSTFKEKQSYEKPSIKKRRKEREALERRLMMENREQQIISGEWDKKQKKKDLKRKQRHAEHARKNLSNE